MPYIIGVAVALTVGLLAHWARFDRDRSFYPTLLAVTASVYVLFAVMSGAAGVVAVEALVMGVFLVAAGAGFRLNLWLIVGGFAAHGVMDAFHGHLIVNAGMPAWWPAFCLAFDVIAALVLTNLLIQKHSLPKLETSMLNPRLLGAALFVATFANTARGQDSTTSPLQLRSAIGFSAVQMRPQGALGRNIGFGYGVNGAYLYRLDAAGMWSIRADIGAVAYGNDSKRTALSETVGGRVQVDVRTVNYIVPLSVGPQLTWPTGRVRPYVSAGVGGQAFFTESSIETAGNSTIAHSTNQSDFAISWVAGGGIYLPLMEGKTKVMLDLGVQYLNGGNARYLAPGSLVDLPGGQVKITSLESNTHVMLVRIGARVGL